MNLVFLPIRGSGIVTFTVASDAFIAEARGTRAIVEEFELITFSLNVTVRTDRDGTFPVVVTARNEDGTVLDYILTYMPVWSTEHANAVDRMVTVRTLLANLPFLLESPDARQARFDALELESRAQAALAGSNWSEVTRLADELIGRVRTAETAEAASVSQRLAEARRNEQRRVEAEEEQARALTNSVLLQARLVALQEAEQDVRTAAVVREYATAGALAFVIIGGAVALARWKRRVAPQAPPLAATTQAPQAPEAPSAREPSPAPPA